MSLHARIAIASSRRVFLLDSAAVLGGLGLLTATAAARLDAAWPVAIGLVLLGGLVAMTWRGRRSGADESLFVFGEGPRVEVHRRDAPSVATFLLGEDSVRWPGFSILHLVPAAFTGGGGRRVIVFDRALAVDEARRLRRYLLWVARGGARPDLTIDRPS